MPIAKPVGPSNHASVTYLPATTLGRDVQAWREEAIATSVHALLSNLGCTFTIDDLARHVGVSRGSLFITRSSVVHAIERVLDEWTEGVSAIAVDDDDPFGNACHTLLACEAGGRPAIPCCLAQSPCPHRWIERWAELALRFGLGATDISLMLGEALQAIAASEPIRSLIVQGRTDEAVERTLSFFDTN